MSDESGVFAGLRVVEFGQYVAAPYAAEQFAHGGADVLCIEPVAGTPTRLNSPPAGGDGRQFVVKARGKRSVALALGTDEGRAAAKKLCLGADIVISNMRPGAAAKMGLDHQTLRAEKPSLIYGEVDGFGSGGSWAGRACVDLVAQGFGGLMTSVAASPDLEFDRQQLFCDYTAGALLAFGVSAALFHRERTGEGQHVATSLVAAALVLQHRTASVFLDHDADKVQLVEDRHSGASFDEIFERRQQLGGKLPSTYGVFRTADGWLAMGAIPSHLTNVSEVLDIAPDESGALPKDEVEAAIAKRETTAVVDELIARGVPVAPVRFLEEVLLDPDSEAAGLVERYEHPRLGTVVMPAPPVRFETEGAFVASPNTPKTGEHTAEELRSLGYEPEVIDRLVADGIIAAAT